MSVAQLIYASADSTLAEKLAFLKRPSTYSEHPISVDAIETHMSWVFLTPEYVYKLKKPIRVDSVDYSSVDARERNCRNEVQLNRRLAATVYLGVVHMVRHAGGQLTLGGKGEVVDWLVKMRRLPAERMLDVAIQQQSVEEVDVCKFSRVLSNFYRDAAPVNIPASAYYWRFDNEIFSIRTELAQLQYGLDEIKINRPTAALMALLHTEPELLQQRSEQQKIVEAHGDLRPEHVCILDQPVFIDCLEFDRQLRLLDPVDELAYLALECERLGAPAVGDLVMKNYMAITDDHPPAKLVDFYKSFRALVRARLSIRHLKDTPEHQHYQWKQKSIGYLDSSSKYAARLADKQFHK